MSSGDEFDDHYTRRRKPKHKEAPIVVAAAPTASPASIPKAQRVERLSKSQSKPQTQDTSVPWVEDAKAPACFVCGVHFSMIKRRHHCRQCGNVICSTCSQFLPTTTEKKPTRVCTSCANKMPTPVQRTPTQERSQVSKTPQSTPQQRVHSHIDDWFLDDSIPPTTTQPPATNISSATQTRPSKAKATKATPPKISKPERFADIVFDDRPLVGSDEELSPARPSSAISRPSKAYHQTVFSSSKPTDPHLRMYDTAIDMSDDFEMPPPKQRVNAAPFHGYEHVDMSEISQVSDAFLTNPSQPPQSIRSSMSHLSSEVTKDPPSEPPPAAESTHGGFTATLKRFFGGKEGKAHAKEARAHAKEAKAQAKQAKTREKTPSPPKDKQAKQPTPTPQPAPAAKTTAVVATALEASRRLSTPQDDLALDRDEDVNSWKNEPPKPSLWTRGVNVYDTTQAAHPLVSRDIDPNAMRQSTTTSMPLKRKDTFDDVFDGPRQLNASSKAPTTATTSSWNRFSESAAVRATTAAPASVEETSGRPRRGTFDDILAEAPQSTWRNNPYGNYGSSNTQVGLDRFATEPAKTTPSVVPGNNERTRNNSDVDFGVSVPSKEYEFDPITGTYVAPRVANYGRVVDSTAMAMVPANPAPAASNGVADDQSARLIVDKLTSLESELAELKALLRERKAQSPRAKSPRRTQSAANIFDNNSSEEEEPKAPVVPKRKSKKAKDRRERKDSFADLFEDDSTQLDNLYDSKLNGASDGDESPKPSTKRNAKVNHIFGSDEDDSPAPRSRGKKSIRAKKDDDVDAWTTDSVDAKSRRKAGDVPRRQINLDDPFASDREDNHADEEEIPSLKNRQARRKDRQTTKSAEQPQSASKSKLDEGDNDHIDAMFNEKKTTTARSNINFESLFSSGDKEDDSPKKPTADIDSLLEDISTEAVRPPKPEKQRANSLPKLQEAKRGAADALDDDDKIDAVFADVKVATGKKPQVKFESLFSGGDDDEDEESPLPSLSKKPAKNLLDSLFNDTSEVTSHSSTLNDDVLLAKQASPLVVDSSVGVKQPDQPMKVVEALDDGSSDHIDAIFDEKMSASKSILKFESLFSSEDDDQDLLVAKTLEKKSSTKQSMLGDELQPSIATKQAEDVKDSELPSSSSSSHPSMDALEPAQQAKNDLRISEASSSVVISARSDEINTAVDEEPGYKSNTKLARLFASDDNEEESLFDSPSRKKSTNIESLFADELTDSSHVPEEPSGDAFASEPDYEELLFGTSSSRKTSKKDSFLDENSNDQAPPSQQPVEDIVKNVLPSDEPHISPETHVEEDELPSLKKKKKKRESKSREDQAVLLSPLQQEVVETPAIETPSTTPDALDKVDDAEYDATWSALQEEEKQRKQNAMRRQRQLHKQMQKEKTTKKPKKKPAEGDENPPSQ
ncbi:unnamed protein product [Aphanomyces euteiches]